MNRRDYETLRSQAEQECKTTIAEAKARLKARQEALDWAYQSTRPGKAATRRVEDGRAPNHGAAEDDALISKVSRLLGQVGEVFDRSAVESRLMDSGVRVSRAVLSKTLDRLAKRGEIVIRERGRGRRATRYEKSVEKGAERS